MPLHHTGRHRKVSSQLNRLSGGRRGAIATALLAVALGAALVTAVGSLPRSASASTTLKPPVQGLLDRHHYPAAGYTSAVKSFVVDVPWADLQPAAGGPIVHPNAIDSAITQARKSGFALRLRIESGIYAPSWAKQLGGPPITVYYTTSGQQSGVAGTIGRFWTPAFASAYADFQQKLAAAYDAVPEIRETAATQCQMIYAETYLRDTQNPQNVQALLHAGFTATADDSCHRAQLQAHTVWHQTRTEVAFNPYQHIYSDGTVRPDEAYTESQIDLCRQVLGARCVVSNHSLSSTRTSDPLYAQLYAKMKAVGPPLAFQTATYAKIGNYQATLDYAVKLGADSVELPTGYTNWPATTLAKYNAELAANPTG